MALRSSLHHCFGAAGAFLYLHQSRPSSLFSAVELSVVSVRLDEHAVSVGEMLHIKQYQLLTLGGVPQGQLVTPIDSAISVELFTDPHFLSSIPAILFFWLFIFLNPHIPIILTIVFVYARSLEATNAA